MFILLDICVQIDREPKQSTFNVLFLNIVAYIF